MITYILLVSWIIIVGLLASKNKTKGIHFIYLIISFFLIYLVMALRSSSIGADTQNYVNLFENISNGLITVNTDIYYEKGFLLLLTALGNISGVSQFMIASVSLLILTPVFILIVKYSKLPWMSIMLFITLTFFFNSMNITRQYIAIGFTILAVINLINKKNKFFFINVFIAMLFHESAVAIIIIWFLSKIKLTQITNKKKIIILLSVVMLPTILLQMMPVFLPNYIGYINSAETNQLGSVLFFCVYMVFFIFIYMVDRKEKNEYKQNIFLWLLFIGMVIQCYGIQLSIFSRIAEYFTIYYIIMIPNTIVKIDKKTIYIVLYSITLSTIIYMVSILLLRPEWFKVTPYHFFWSNN